MTVTVEELHSIMCNKNNIRNVLVIADAGHGKTAILDSLVATAGITSQEVTESNSLISLYYEMPEDYLRSYKDKRAGNGHLINLIDSPMCCNLSNDVQPVLCITDGALVVVDCFEGVTLRTKTSICEALNMKIQPVLTLNKIDRFFLEQNVDGEKAYQTLSGLIDSVNATMSSHKDVQVYPNKGTVVFSSGLHGWAVAISNFAKMYSSIFKVEESKMIDRLWGENFFDLATKKWTKKNTGTATCKRGFVQFCYEPIREIMNACMNSKHKLWPMLEKIHVTVSSAAKELVGIELVKHVMQVWLPASSALSEMMVYHIPSPEKAQRHCAGNFGVDLDSIYRTSVRNCDAEGPLVLYVSKMTLALGKGSSDQFIKKNSTLTSVKVAPMRAPVVGVRVDCKAYSDLPKLVEALKKLANTPAKTRLNDIPLSECPPNYHFLNLDEPDPLLLYENMMDCIGNHRRKYQCLTLFNNCSGMDQTILCALLSVPENHQLIYGLMVTKDPFNYQL
uniref:Tr-type G domain-containing protein n=1 Tax=Oryza punctata TaxID=4537 RepID=A0A0E0L3L9_ORYPU